MSEELKPDLVKILDILIRQRQIIILIFCICIFVAIIVAYYLPDIYKSSTLILVEPQKVPEDYVKSIVTTGVEDRLHTLSQQILSRTRLETIIKEFELYKKCPAETSMEDIVSSMRKRITVEVQKNPRLESGSSSFSISFEDEDPVIVMKITNKLAGLFIDENLKTRENQAKGTAEFLERQLDDVKTQLEKREKTIRDFKEQFMGELPEQLDANLRALDRFEKQKETLTEELQNAEERKIQLDKRLNDLDQGPGGDSSDRKVLLLKRLDDLNAELIELKQTYKDQYPDIIKIKKEINALEQELENFVEDNGKSKNIRRSMNPTYRELVSQIDAINFSIKSSREELRSISEMIELYQKRVENTPKREQELMTLTRDYENIKEYYQSILDKKLNAQIAENMEMRKKGEQFRILDPASIPARPYKPNRYRIIMMGFVLGIVLGSGLGFALEYTKRSFRDVEELKSHVKIPVIASIPEINEKLSFGNLQSNMEIVYLSKFKQGLLPVLNPKSNVVEEYRRLYAKLLKLRHDEGIKIFGITSSLPQEGKTLTSMNLSMVIARDTKMKVLLVDSDLRKPKIHNYLNIDKKLGFTDVLKNYNLLPAAIKPWELENLSVLTAGKIPQNPVSLYLSSPVEKIKENIKNTYEVIIVDTPPVIPIADYDFWKDLVEGVLFVVKAEVTPKAAVLESINRIKDNKVIGIIFNCVKDSFKNHYYYGYSYSYSENIQKKNMVTRIKDNLYSILFHEKVNKNKSRKED